MTTPQSKFQTVGQSAFKRTNREMQRSLLRLQSIDDIQQWQIQVQPLIAWVLLLLSKFSAAAVPCWLMNDLDSQSFTRNSWRCFMIAVLLLPFMAYQRRRFLQANTSYLSFFTMAMLKKNFICSINACILHLFNVTACRFTSLTHVFAICSITPFIYTLNKLRIRQNCHQFQFAGSILLSFGLGCFLFDSVSLPQLPNIYNQKYLANAPYYRVIGDLLALCGCVVGAFLSKRYTVPNQPRFCNLFCFNFFLSFNFISFGYFFGGSQFSFNVKYGVFGLFSYQNFVTAFYVSIMLGISLLISNILVEQMFSNLIINIASCFEMLLTSMLYQMLDIEVTHQGYTYLGFGFLVPGMILIVGGQKQLIKEEFEVYYYLSYKPPHKEMENYQEISPNRVRNKTKVSTKEIIKENPLKQ